MSDITTKKKVQINELSRDSFIEEEKNEKNKADSVTDTSEEDINI